MVFGLGKKQIEVTLDRHSYSPGETITGKVILKLKKPTEAKQLRVELIGVGERRWGRPRGRCRSASIVYHHKIPLDGEKTYAGGEYNFHINIPANIFQSPVMPSTKIGKAVEGLDALTGVSFHIGMYNTHWHVRAVLERPRKLDICSQLNFVPKNANIVIRQMT